MSANGGYACGLVARHVAGPAEVTLRAPPPLDTPLTLQPMADGRVVLKAGETLVAEGAPAEVSIEVPPPVSWDEAAATALPLESHLLPECFVCGPQREAGDGLRLFTRPVPGHNVIAAPFTPLAQDCDDGVLRSEVVWSLLDCPSGLALWMMGGWQDRFGLLGRLAARIDRPLRLGERYVVMGWVTGQEGRKGFAGAAVVDDAGAVCAVSKATWIVLK
jgi:hypothetical protein